MSDDSRTKAEESYESMMQRVRARVKEVRTRPDFDPRREKELDDLYRQYVPPYAAEESTSLIDIAERDSYIVTVPPLGSQKKGGVVIKKSIRKAIGWYIQFVTQQISTFGTGVARALRSMSNDIEALKKQSGASAGNEVILTIDLASPKNMAKYLSTIAVPHSHIVISDSLSDADLASLVDSARITVVEPRTKRAQSIDPIVDTRITTLSKYCESVEDQTVNGLVVSGIIECAEPQLRTTLISESARICTRDGWAVFVVSDTPSAELIQACEIMGTTPWSLSTWKKVISHYFDTIESETNESFVIITARKNAQEVRSAS